MFPTPERRHQLTHRSLIAGVVAVLMTANAALADSSNYSARFSREAAASAGNVARGTSSALLGLASVPLTAAGLAGMALGDVGRALSDAAGRTLPLTDETVSVAPDRGAVDRR